MSVIVGCGCGKRYQLDDSLAGQMVRCPACSANILVPSAAAQDSGLADLIDEDKRTQRPPSARQPVAAPRAARGDYQASIPGEFHPNFLHYYLCYPSTLVLLAGGLVLALIALSRQLPAVVPLILLISILWFAGSEAKSVWNKCRLGCVTPGVVVSVKPPYVAVMTDLIKDAGHRPVLKVVKQPLGRMAGGPPTVGMRVPTVSYYYGPPNESSWRDFHPEVINCMTTNPQTIARTLNAIDERDWQELAAALAQVKELQPGLYRMWEFGWQVKTPAGQTKYGRAAAAVIIGVVFVGLVAPVLIGKPVEQKPLAAKPADAPPAPPQPHVAPPEVRPPAEPAREENAVPPQGPVAPIEKAPPQVAQPDMPVAPPVVPPVPAPAQALPEQIAPDLGALPPAAAPAPAQPAAAPAPGGPFKVGDRVEVKWGSKWWPSTVVKVEAARYFVDYDDWNRDEWADAKDVRSAPLPVDLATLKVGDKIQVKGASNTWRPGTVAALEPNRVKVRYDGWSEFFDEWKEASHLRRPTE